jgi:hypothetical protein
MENSVENMGFFGDDFTGEERAERIQPSKEFVKAKLTNIELIKLKEGTVDAVRFTFTNDEGAIFTQNILEPFNENSTADQRRNNIDKIMHIYGAFLPLNPTVKYTTKDGKQGREIKQIFQEMTARKIVDIHNFLFPRLLPNWRELPVTLKISYPAKKQQSNIIQFPLYPPFIHTEASLKFPVSSWKWDGAYDFDTSQYIKPPKDGDNNDTDGSDADTMTHTQDEPIF